MLRSSSILEVVVFEGGLLPLHLVHGQIRSNVGRVIPFLKCGLSFQVWVRFTFQETLSIWMAFVSQFFFDDCFDWIFYLFTTITFFYFSHPFLSNRSFTSSSAASMPLSFSSALGNRSTSTLTHTRWLNFNLFAFIAHFADVSTQFRWLPTVFITISSAAL